MALYFAVSNSVAVAQQAHLLKQDEEELEEIAEEKPKEPPNKPPQKKTKDQRQETGKQRKARKNKQAMRNSHPNCGKRFRKTEEIIWIKYKRWQAQKNT